MLPISSSADFARACDEIHGSLTALSDRNASIAEIDEHLDRLVRGTGGREVQHTLLEVCLAIQRYVNASIAQQFVSQEAAYIRSQMFRAVDKYGHPDGALQVLEDRIVGPDGFVEMTKAEFTDIRANVSHLSGSADDEDARYWRLRMKSFKNRILSEVRQYIHASQIAVDAAADTFNTSVSRSMNKVLAVKSVSEEFQEILIEHRANTVAIALPVISIILSSEVVKDHTFADFLCEAADGQNPSSFQRRLQAIIDRAPKLSLFEQVYDDLSESSSMHWHGIEQTLHSFQNGLDAALEKYHESIESMIDMLDYADLPDDFPAEELMKPFLKITQDAFAKLKTDCDGWLQKSSATKRELQQHLHPL